MKKKFRSTIVFIVLAAMALGMTGCGAASQSTGAKDEPSPSEVPEYVYSAEYRTLSEGSKNSIIPKIYTDEGFYATSYEKLGDNIPEGVVPEYEDQYAVYGTKLFYVTYDGTIQQLSGYEAVKPTGENADKQDYYSSSDTSGLAMTPDGKLVTFDNLYESWYDGPEGIDRNDDGYYDHIDSANRYFIRTLDESGNELSCAEINVSGD